MPRRRFLVSPASVPELERRIAAIETELDVVRDFPAAVLTEAQAASASVVLPERDCTDVPFVTIDPPGARDLDQAMHIERDGDGYVVHYAIADVAAFVRPGGAVDVEAHRRGQTLYAPSYRIALHPPVLSEGAASLLAGEVRPALVWRIELDADGESTAAEVSRAKVCSTRQCDYQTVQQEIDDGTAAEVFALLREVGELRKMREQERGGVSLPLPDQEVEVADGAWSLSFRQNLESESWNEQISLLTGMAAAQLMIGAGIGLVRTLPPADPRAIRRLRRAAAGLGIAWQQDLSYPDFVRTIDPTSSRGAAMLNECTSLLRGAGYAAFDGEVPAQPVHAAIAAAYAHATAPLRRLADRYVGETCVAICAGEPVPEWVRAGLPDLPAIMQGTGRTAATFDREIVDLVEAGMLQQSVGDIFDGVVIDTDEKSDTKGTVMISDPAIEAAVVSRSTLPLGDEVRVRLTTADLDTRTVRFEQDDAVSR